MFNVVLTVLFQYWRSAWFSNQKARKLVARLEKARQCLRHLSLYGLRCDVLVLDRLALDRGVRGYLD
jgi:hypothetical protein